MHHGIAITGTRQRGAVPPRRENAAAHVPHPCPDPVAFARPPRAQGAGVLSAALGRLAWLAGRVRSMSARELLHRLREASRRHTTRTWRQGWARYADGSQLVPELPGLHQRLMQAPAVTRQALADSAAAFRGGHFEALGVAWPAGAVDMQFPESVWRLDPRTGASWPGAERYCFDIGYRLERGIGDVKYVWEFGRMQFLPVLAADAALNGNAQSLAAVRCAVDSWYLHNPPFRGVHWAELLNVATRAISVLLAVSLCGERLPGATIERARALLAAHARLLALFPSLHSSANNHLIAESAAEYLVALAMPQQPDAAQARGAARATLIAEADKQILADGWPAEQSPSYGAFSAEFLLLSAWVGAAAGEPFREATLDRLDAFGEHLQWLANRHARVPALGDNDEGRVLTHGAHESDYPMSVASAIAAMRGRPLRCARRPVAPLRDLVFGVPEAARAPGPGQRQFMQGGCSVDRRRLADRDCVLTFDHGALGYLSIAAHGHADALAITLDIDGQAALCDPGTYLYHSGAQWRDWFRGTRAHNTLCLGGSNQSRMAGPFNWTRKASAVLEAATPGPLWQWCASHDGYLQAFGVRHQRCVSATEEGYLVVDRLLGNGSPRDAEVVFQLGIGLQARRHGPAFYIYGADGAALLRIRFDADGELSCRRGGDIGQGGWVSPRFGVREPADRIAWVGPVPADGAAVHIQVLPPQAVHTKGGFT
jgi:hypothetical protein